MLNAKTINVPLRQRDSSKGTDWKGTVNISFVFKHCSEEIKNFKKDAWMITITARNVVGVEDCMANWQLLFKLSR